jgi:transcriptional regulator with XRE-family HTH domain
MNMADVGSRLKEARLNSGWRKQYAAAHALGINPVTLSNYERGRRSMSAEMLFRLCDLYCISADSLRAIEKKLAA